MKLIIGLGNPGKEYMRTRHNAGFLALDELAKQLECTTSDWKESKKAKALYCKTTIDGTSVELLKPQTFMNDSGISVAYAAKNHNLKPTNIIVIHDDKDIPLGEYRDQTDRSAAGHNGVKSIIEHLGTQNFRRIRIGVATPEMAKYDDKADFVLGKFSKEEFIILNKILSEVATKLLS
ncbi:MAG: aminoacyl-tRNA hydrolase [Candidatus Magasanikbacteria bacterium RIFOXYA2_FULL_44_8]|uniref:Peptidyl-tRNA hydrolase n=1 Tax=Candidatus Magasanikbacteria bacterium RIFOXYA2_FULL_44_8 TaxID=1798696 RepID=A0A1F6NL61_9BACT|nr:MAG: aminoacyl-tRNA hydrolase [Candidatus Magasanikbacteria bacterium RIFOXYA2_FULL_44_8]